MHRIKGYKTKFFKGRQSLLRAAKSRRRPKNLCELLNKFGNNINEEVNEVTGDTLLHIASDRAYDVGIIRALIKYGADVNKRNKFGETPLHNAIRRDFIDEGRMDVVWELISKNGDTNAPNNAGVTPFHLALKLGDLVVAKILWYFGGDVHSVCSRGNSILHFAAKSGDVDILKFVLDNGANVDERNYRDETSLHIVSSACNYDCIKFLLSRGADANALDHKNITPFFRVIKRNLDTVHPNPIVISRILKTLVDHSARICESIPYMKDQVITLCFDLEWKIILREAAKSFAVNVDLGFLTTKAKKYYNDCILELTIAKNCKVRKDNWVTYWHIIAGSLENLSNYAENKNLVKVLKRGSYRKKFRIYGDVIQRNIRRGLKKRRELNDEVLNIRGSLPVHLPVEVVKKIIFYRDLYL